MEIYSLQPAWSRAGQQPGGILVVILSLQFTASARILGWMKVLQWRSVFIIWDNWQKLNLFLSIKLFETVNDAFATPFISVFPIRYCPSFSSNQQKENQGSPVLFSQHQQAEALLPPATCFFTSWLFLTNVEKNTKVKEQRNTVLD